MNLINNPYKDIQYGWKNINAPEIFNGNGLEHSERKIISLQLQTQNMITDIISSKKYFEVEKTSNLESRQENMDNYNIGRTENYNKQLENIRNQVYKMKLLQNNISPLNKSTKNNIVDSAEQNIIYNISSHILNDDNKQLENNSIIKQLKDNLVSKRVFFNIINPNIECIGNTVSSPIDEIFNLNTIQRQSLPEIEKKQSQNLFSNIIAQSTSSCLTAYDFVQNLVDYLDYLDLNNVDNSKSLNKSFRELVIFAVNNQVLESNEDDLKTILKGNVKTFSKGTGIYYNQIENYKLDKKNYKNFNSASAKCFINTEMLLENLSNGILTRKILKNAEKNKYIEIQYKSFSPSSTEYFINAEMSTENSNNSTLTQKILKSIGKTEFPEKNYKNFNPILTEYFSVNTETFWKNFNDNNPIIYKNTKNKFMDIVNGFYSSDNKTGIEKLNYALYTNDEIKSNLFNKDNYIEQNFESKISDIFKSKNNDSNDLKIADVIKLTSYDNNIFKNSKENSTFSQHDISKINDVKNIGDINSAIDISNEDILYIRNAAEKETVNRYSQKLVSPVVHITFTGDIRETADIDVINEAIKNNIISELNSGAENNHF